MAVAFATQKTNINKRLISGKPRVSPSQSSATHSVPAAAVITAGMWGNRPAEAWTPRHMHTNTPPPGGLEAPGEGLGSCIRQHLTHNKQFHHLFSYVKQAFSKTFLIKWEPNTPLSN